MNLKLSSVKKPRLYVKKSLKESLTKNTLSTVDLFEDESQLGKNLGYCLTSANQDHSILNDFLNSNLFNDSLSLETTLLSNKIKLSPKTIEVIKEAIKYHLSNEGLFPIFRFNKGFTIVFHDQRNKLNNFVKEFNPYYSNHYYIRLLSKIRMRFKVINPAKVDYLMKILDRNSGKIFGRSFLSLKENQKKGKGKGKRVPVINPIITMELLTKIPNKHPDKIIKNRRLEMQYGKAKEAAIGIRRLEYAYNMKKGFMFNKMLFQKNVITIQKWWRSLSRCISEFLVVSQIQSHYRGHLSRMALYDSLRAIDDILPFLCRVDNIIVKNKIEAFFNRLFRNFAYLAVYNKMGAKIEMIKRHIKAHIIRKGPKIEFPKQYVAKCNMAKHICELTTQEKIDLIQSTTKYHLMTHSDKIMRGFGYNVHPYLYFKLKYAKQNSKEVYKKKVVKFHHCFQSLRLLNLRVNKKTPNAFEYFRIAMTRKHFKTLVDCDKANVYKRKNVLMNKFVDSLVKEKKLQGKFLGQWRKNANEIKRADKMKRLTKITQTITAARNERTALKYFQIWKMKKSPIYQMASLFKKSKIANRNANLNKKKSALFNELLKQCNSEREGKRGIELKNSILKWKTKVIQLQRRDAILNKEITKTELKNRNEMQTKVMMIFIDKCKAKKRESFIEKAMVNKTNREYSELKKYFGLWKSHCQYRILHSIFCKTFNKTQKIITTKLNQLNANCIAIQNRNNFLKNSIDYINDSTLLKRHLALYRNKSNQLCNIEASLRRLVSRLTEKDNKTQLKRYNAKWQKATIMNRLLTNQHSKWLLNHLNKWRSYSHLLHLINQIIGRKDRLDTISISKYFNRWLKYNEVHKKLIHPFYQTKTKLFAKIISTPIDKRRTIYKAVSFVNIFNTAIENKIRIYSQLKKAILNKHSKDIQISATKWKEIASDVTMKEEIKQRKDFLLKDIFTKCALRYSSLNLKRYFNQWRRKAPYYLRIGVSNKHKQHAKLVQLYFFKWKKQSFKYKLTKASDAITSRVKQRNHFREFCSGLNTVFIKKLIQSASIIKNRSKIQMIIYKNIFKKIKDSITYRNQLKSLTRLSSTANRKFKLALLRWKLKAKRIAITQRRFYLNVQRGLGVNYKKSVLCDLLKKAKDRREGQKGKFFKKYKKAAGVYYIKCSHLNLQVFFLYRQKKYLSKRKYRMIKYVINQMNRKLIKHQSLKRYLGNWRRAIRFSILKECIDKRIKLLNQGTVALRIWMKKWVM